MNRTSFRKKLGCWLNERWKAEVILRLPAVAKTCGWNWTDNCNRNERISRDQSTGGRICHWRDSSMLTLSKTFPRVGGRLLQQSLKEWPVRLSDKDAGKPTVDPEVSIIIGVRGTARLQSFQTTLASLFGQQGCRCEIVVVEQSVRPEFESHVPDSVRYIHTQATHPNMPYNRSWTLNVGARVARGRIVVLHDADMVVPARFAAVIAERMSDNFDVLRLGRYIFYLDQPSSEGVYKGASLGDIATVVPIRQNNCTPIALTREAYLRIGGHDESFYAWGLEDVEFLNRARTLQLSEGTFLPVVHLWHEDAPNRRGDGNGPLLSKLLAIPESGYPSDGPWLTPVL